MRITHSMSLACLNADFKNGRWQFLLVFNRPFNKSPPPPSLQAQRGNWMRGSTSALRQSHSATIIHHSISLAHSLAPPTRIPLSFNALVTQSFYPYLRLFLNFFHWFLHSSHCFINLASIILYIDHRIIFTVTADRYLIIPIKIRSAFLILYIRTTAAMYELLKYFIQNSFSVPLSSVGL